MAELAEAALNSKAWPFTEARRLLKRIGNGVPDKGHVLFQTGYGPSGLPHIGTFGEVVRTTMVRNAFGVLSDIPTSLICFSDDMDGFRKVPGNVPNQSMMSEDLGLPLTRVRDPFGSHESFAHHNNDKLREFLDSFGIDYTFVSATEMYQSGQFDEMLLRALERYDRLMEIILPTLGGVTEDRPDTYSPFLPISPISGRVLQVPTLERDPDRGTIVYSEPDGERIEIPVTGGNVKLQWKADWAMRWAALEVDFEMYGKDLIPSAELARSLCRELGCRPPVEMFYELFLDENGRKISKSRGVEGFSMEKWLDYASPESLSMFMYQKPKTAKRLYFDIVPRTFDEYHRLLAAYPDQDPVSRLNNPAWHIHAGNPPLSGMVVSYSMLLNLVSATGEADTEVICGMLARYMPDMARHPDLEQAIQGAIRYFNECVLPGREYRQPDDSERLALADLVAELRLPDCPGDPEGLQRIVYAIGKKHDFDPLREWFRCIYQVLFGTDQGPRFGSFIALFGIDATIELIESRLE